MAFFINKRINEKSRLAGGTCLLINQLIILLPER